MGKGQAERLFPLVEELLAEAQLERHDLNAVVVATGPGNFTGVRIGVAAARGLGLALGATVVGVSVLEALAYKNGGTCLVTVDARGDQLYWQQFREGDPLISPSVNRIDEVAELAGTNQICAGFRAPDLAEMTNGLLGQSHEIKPSDLIAAVPHETLGDCPIAAPLYVRPADAALPSKPLPRILA